MACDHEGLADAVGKLRVGGYHRHVLLCVGSNCCSARTGEEAWGALKRELKACGLSPGTAGAACFRTKVHCLRVCQGGPLAVVYPEGTWYAGLTADRVPEFVARHLVGGEPVQEWVFARNPLPRGDDESPSAPSQG